MTSANDHANVQAEAAAWLARLHSPSKSPATEAGFRRWLQQDERHQAEFEKATEVWELLGSVSFDSFAANDDQPGGHRWRRSLLAIAASLALLIVSSTYWLSRMPTYDTAVGEQEVVMLVDGSRVALNTNSKLRVEYSKAERRVVLDRGEALFEVSKDPSRPFLVIAGDQVIRALGTKFVVRRDGDETRVTLLEGRVEVRGPRVANKAVAAVLKPGQRMTVTADSGAALDAPQLDTVTAWRRGEVVFDDVSLLEAAEELNRYSEKRLIIADPAVGSMRISGVFSTGDVSEVARAVAALHGLKVETNGRDYLLKSA